MLPVLVGGDFNTTGLDTALDALRPTLTDAFAGHGTGWGATGTNDWPLFRVDQIWTDARLVPTRVYAEKTTSSDHRMVICDAMFVDESNQDSGSRTRLTTAW
jgi:endonuclease/exonuclease/phosphatase (EEP) superfamily protein YafD